MARSHGGAVNCHGPSGVYATLLAKIMPDISAAHSFKSWTSAKSGWARSRRAFRALWGQMPNQKLEHRYGRAATDTCPLCRSARDGVGHILGQCPRLKGAHIKRHDTAVRTIFKALRHATAAPAYCVVDAGVEARSMRGVHADRPPAWALPNTPESDLDKMRPDILVLHNRDARGNVLTPGLPNKAVIFEVGYCSDFGHEDRAAVKRDQHKALADALRAADWTVEGPHAITIGRCGTIPTATAQTLVNVGMLAKTIDTCLADIHIQAVNAVGDIETIRRSLLKGLPPGRPPEPP